MGWDGCHSPLAAVLNALRQLQPTELHRLQNPSPTTERPARFGPRIFLCVSELVGPYTSSAWSSTAATTSSARAMGSRTRSRPTADAGTRPTTTRRTRSPGAGSGRVPAWPAPPSQVRSLRRNGEQGGTVRRLAGRFLYSFIPGIPGIALLAGCGQLLHTGDQHQPEADLCQQVNDRERGYLSIQADRLGSFGSEQPKDGVEEPERREDHKQLVVERRDTNSLGFRRCPDRSPDDVQDAEGETRS